MLKYRLITGPILIAVLLAIVIADNALDSVRLSEAWQSVFVGKTHPPRGLLLFGLALVVAPLAAIELSRIFRAVGILTRPWLTGLAAMLGLTLSYAVPMQTQAIPAIAIVSSGMIVMFVASLLIFSQDRNVEGVVAAAGAVMFAMVYLGLMLGFLLALRREHSAWLIVGVIMVTKMCDTGAYFTGRAIGRHKMIPWLSPGKTWEGLGGGVALAVVTGMVLAWATGWLPREADHVPLWLGAICGVVFAIVGQCGDLVMSLFKRSAGLKDSSTILPGLGGVLDVLDSPLLVAPVAFWILTSTLPADISPPAPPSPTGLAVVIESRDASESEQTMALMDSLRHLHQVDAQVRGLRSRLDSAELYLKSQEKLLLDVRARREELLTRRKQVQAAIANHEVEIKSIDERLEKLRDELNSAVTNKQYSAILSELNTFKTSRNEVEDRVIEELEQVESIDLQVAAIDEQIIERTKVRDSASADLEQRRADVGERLEELETERQAAAAAVPGSVLTIFDSLADVYDGEAMASIIEIDRRHREYACEACHMHLPFERVSLLMSSGEELVRCSACHRILFIMEELRGALAKK